MGPDYKRPDATAISATYAGATNGCKVAERQGQFPKGNWWEVFGDPELNTVELQTAGANQELKAAVARFNEARAAMNITRAGLFPSVDFAGSAIRQRISPATPLTTAGKAA